MTAPVAGWYPDPKDAAGLRWFDGGYWTADVVPALAPAVDAPPDPDRRRRLVVGSVVAGVLAVVLLTAAAVPVFHRAQVRSQLAALDHVTCAQLGDEAIELAATGTYADLGPLSAVADTRIATDRRGALVIPAAGVEEFVMSCTGMGTLPDGSSAPLTIELYIDQYRQHLLWFTWQT